MMRLINYNELSVDETRMQSSVQGNNHHLEKLQPTLPTAAKQVVDSIAKYHRHDISPFI